MNPWIVLLSLAVLALVFVLVPVGSAAFARWRRPWRLTCPRAGEVAQIRVGASRAATAEVFGRRATIDRCSLWPGLRGCSEECLALSTTAMRAMRPGTPPPRPGEGAALRTILVPLDGSTRSEAVLPAVRELARVSGAHVRLLRVVSAGAAVRGDDDRIVAFADQETARIEDEARVYLRRAAAELGGAAVETAVRFGEPVGQIVEEAETAGADLIALAARRRLGFGRLGGRVSRSLGRATTIPLLLVPYGERAAA